MTASESFKQLPGLAWLRKREQIPRGVPTHHLGTDMEWVGRSEVALEGSFLNQWFPDAAQQEVEENGTVLYQWHAGRSHGKRYA